MEAEDDEFGVEDEEGAEEDDAKDVECDKEYVVLGVPVDGKEKLVSVVGAGVEEEVRSSLAVAAEEDEYEECGM